MLGDHLGSTVLIVNSSGSVVARKLYKAWGEERYASGSMGTKYEFTGQRTDSYINLVQMGSRWYEPYLNHWLQPDSIVPDPQNPLNWDKYAYVNNNPINFSDPTGHKACSRENDGTCSTFDEDVIKLLDEIDKVINIPTKDEDKDGYSETPDKKAQPVKIGSYLGCEESTYTECFYTKHLLKINKKMNMNKKELALLFIAVHDDLKKRSLNGWDRSRYDTPFWDGKGSAPGQSCFGGRCFDRQEVNYFAEGMYSAAIHEPRNRGQQAVADWKFIMYVESPSEGTKDWFDIGYVAFGIIESDE